MPSRKKKEVVSLLAFNLTAEEKRVAKTSTFFSYNRRAEWGWKGKGVSPDAKVAQVRGVKFTIFEMKDLPNRNNYVPSDPYVADQAQVDVARWLGYATTHEYNIACETKEAEVKQRLREAK